MNLYAVNAEDWKMDGGVVFGVVPKAIWQKQYPADENNLLPVKSRCMLIESGKRKILIDTGMGRKQDEKYYTYKYLFGMDELLLNINKKGVMPEEITDVILTHLHDDHVGGAVRYNGSGEQILSFPNAKHYVSREQYEWAVHPNDREGASYFPENYEPLRKAGKLVFLEREDESFFPDIQLRFYDGHTRGQIIPVISTDKGKIVFMADFIPSLAHIPLPYLASVDVEPLKALEEKKAFLKQAVQQHYTLFFEHDYYNECCTLKKTPKGIRADQTFSLADFTGK
ncbi:MAG: MBL fold metallo-hydrolase [Bacteroidales bacterium]